MNGSRSLAKVLISSQKARAFRESRKVGRGNPNTQLGHQLLEAGWHARMSSRFCR